MAVISLSKLRELIAAHRYLVALLLIAFAFRVAGICWGFPSTLNNDESALVRSALGMRFGDLNPHYFDWPSLYRYLNFFLFAAFIKLRIPIQAQFGVETMRRVLPFWWGPNLPFYFLARLLTAILGTATVYLVYKIGRRFLSRGTSLVAALFLAVNYYHVINSQIATLDAAMTFFFALSLYFTLKILETGKLGDYLLAGIFLGLATSTKYNAGLGFLPILTAHFLRIGHISSIRLILKDLWKPLLAGLAALGAFLAGTPYAILDWGTFWQADDIHGFLWTFGRTVPGAKWWWLVERAFFGGWGLPLGLLIILGYVLRARKFLREKDRLSLVLLSFPIPYFLYLGSWSKPRSQYMLPIMLFEAMFGAEAFVFLVGRFLKKFRGAAAVGLILLVTIPVMRTARFDIRKIRGDTRVVAKYWIEQNIPRGVHIAGDARKPTGAYGGTLPEIFLSTEESSGRGYFLHPIREWIAGNKLSPEDLVGKFKEHDISFAITSTDFHGQDGVEEANLTLYRSWLEDNALLLKSFTPEWNFGPAISIYQLPN